MTFGSESATAIAPMDATGTLPSVIGVHVAPLSVVLNTPPELSLPAPISVEATGPGGAAVTYAVTATDAEDDPDPTPACIPASGATFPLGTTFVTCSVTDSGGLTAMGTFGITVGTRF